MADQTQDLAVRVASPPIEVGRNVGTRIWMRMLTWMLTWMLRLKRIYQRQNACGK